MPIGGYSVWGGLKQVNNTSPIVMAITSVDSTAFFHDQSYGADSSASGVAALLSAAITLSQVLLRPHEHVNYT